MPFPLGPLITAVGGAVGSIFGGRGSGGGRGGVMATPPFLPPAPPAVMIPAAGTVAATAGRIFGAIRGAGRAGAATLGRAAVSPAARVLGGAANLAILGSLLIDTTTGQVVGRVPRRRGRGITATELRGFRKVNGLLCRVGMVPKRAARRKC